MKQLISRRWKHSVLTRLFVQDISPTLSMSPDGIATVGMSLTKVPANHPGAVEVSISLGEKRRYPKSWIAGRSFRPAPIAPVSPLTQEAARESCEFPEPPRSGESVRPRAPRHYLTITPRSANPEVVQIQTFPVTGELSGQLCWDNSSLFDFAMKKPPFSE